jgi:DNA-binding transcriptional regulator YdaS (Cro superfamily)
LPTVKKSALHRAIEIFGGASELSRRIGAASPQVVSNWLHRAGENGVPSVPVEFCLPIQILTDGKVTASQLRPDHFDIDAVRARLRRNGLIKRRKPSRPAADAVVS